MDHTKELMGVGIAFVRTVKAISARTASEVVQRLLSLPFTCCLLLRKVVTCDWPAV